MPLYEHIFIARQDISPAQVEGLTETLQKIVTDNGGKVAKSEYWGLRSLQYKIKKNRKGHYSLFNIDAPAPVIEELERQEKINDDILRSLTIRVEELDDTPSPVLSRRDRDGKDRDGRDRDGRDRDGRDRDGRDRDRDRDGRDRDGDRGRRG
ncbi:MAG TPA: 30S ribosomal protein S6 [Parvularculaceae bacterium]|nr:30S ribosomal protein S6 [Parvularculaceae bacterium]HNS85885.1 30S ribosomal protein S6 [Parvularculaceae bacterium]